MALNLCWLGLTRISLAVRTISSGLRTSGYFPPITFGHATMTAVVIVAIDTVHGIAAFEAGVIDQRHLFDPSQACDALVEIYPRDATVFVRGDDGVVVHCAR